jgi:DNA polymerase-3 subunit delta'
MIDNHNLKPYPWQNRLWNKLHANKQLRHHAFLLHGPAGIGKFDFARFISKSLLCNEQNAVGACGFCPSCNWFNEASHPDFKLISPEQEDEAEGEASSSKKTKKKTQISIAQIRDLADFTGLSSHSGGGLRIILIYPAEALNNASANALLKMLEEPAEGVVFLLVTQQIQRLLPTIVSRCQKINMPAPNTDQSLAWLAEQGLTNAEQQLQYFAGSPLKALAEGLQFTQTKEFLHLLSHGEKLSAHVAAPALLTYSAEAGIVALQKWLFDLVLMKQVKQVRYHMAYAKALEALAVKVNIVKLLQLQKNLNELRKLALHPLNHELQMEALLVDYTRIFSKA